MSQSVALKAVRFIREFRRQNPNMVIGLAETFLLVIEKPGIKMAEIEEEADIAQSSSSRYAAELGKYGRNRQPGLQLIEKVKDPVDWRQYRLYPTKKGKAFAKQLFDIIDPDNDFQTFTADELKVPRFD